ncbi:lycopene cyclase domain-containing protein [Pedobacter sp. CAN_A7]|uniref:lycopene cyclase domain-containing protein n=1 Tax=Pedobacter sp. CAN_A7 TaxID=2787722 RepID=UPI0018CACECB
MKYTYLLVNFFTIIVPFIFSFHPKLNFYKTWRSFFPAVVITGLFFVLWDNYFTGLGIWGFNEQYTLGIFFGHLPLEEILFFFCIPYACVYTYHCIDLFIKKPLSQVLEKWLTTFFITSSLFVSVLFYKQTYTLFAFICPALLLILAKYVLKVNWLLKFYLIYGILLFPFLIVNGVLTGTGLENPVVWYNEEEIFGLRILTIPVEDVFYGMAMVLMNLLIYKRKEA